MQAKRFYQPRRLRSFACKHAPTKANFKPCHCRSLLAGEQTLQTTATEPCRTLLADEKPKSKPHSKTATPPPNPPTPPAPDSQSHTAPSPSNHLRAATHDHETHAATPVRHQPTRPSEDPASSSPLPSAHNATTAYRHQAPSTNAHDPASPPNTMYRHSPTAHRLQTQNTAPLPTNQKSVVDRDKPPSPDKAAPPR